MRTDLSIASDLQANRPRWWLGNMASALLVTPLLVVWATIPFRRWTRQRIPELGVILASVLILSLLGFSGLSAAPLNGYPRFLLFPAVLWAAYRFGQHGAVNAATIVSVVAIWGTVRGFGPFVGPDPNVSLGLLVVYIGTLTMTNLVLGALVSERRAAGRGVVGTRARDRQRLLVRVLADLRPGWLTHTNEASRRN